MGERAAYLCVEVHPAQLGELARLRTAWAVEQGGTAADGFDERFAHWWKRQRGQRHAWLVRDETGRAVAMGTVAVFERMPHPGLPDARWAHVGNVWVDPAHRRRGVGTLLME